MLTEQDVAFLYDQLISEDINGAFPRGVFVREDKRSNANEKTALAFIKYACEAYLGWDAESMRVYLTRPVLKRLRLELALQYINVPFVRKENSLEYIAEKIYPSLKKSLHDEVLEIYRGVKEGKLPTFPRGFFDGDDGRVRAKFCLQLLLNDSPQVYSQKQLYSLFASKEGNKLLKGSKLYSVLLSAQVYADSLEYLHESLPSAGKSEFWYRYYRYQRAYTELCKEREKANNHKTVKKQEQNTDKKSSLAKSKSGAKKKEIQAPKKPAKQQTKKQSARKKSSSKKRATKKKSS